ncbi:MAG: FadR/GntR family transcriptional regulator [Ancalomicrobiaceae bacterium]|nr:FadR/GntR family transcriptional regulator [Ancalomicrobiaceae bacterium]
MGKARELDHETGSSEERQSAEERPSATSGLVEQVIEEVRTFIHQNHLGAGAMLPSETTFADRLGVSRPVAREAYRALAAVGILDVGNGRRARVAVPDASVLSLVLDHTVHIKQLSIQQIFDVRRTLELRTVSLASLRRSNEEAATLLNLVDDMRRAAASPNDVLVVDIAFHELIAQASRNPLYSLLIGSFRAATRQTFHIGWQSRRTVESKLESINNHQRVADAIAAQDTPRAEQAMSEHFDSAINLLIRAGVV